MNIVKKILSGILILLVLLAIIAAFLPKDYSASTTTTINKPKSVVMDYIKILKNQEQYSIWVMADPNLKPEITGIDGTVGAKQSWNSTSNEVGEGSQTITALTDDRMDVDLHFVRPMKGEAKASNILKAIDSTHTELTSEFYGTNKWPFNIMNFFGKKMIIDAETKNLKNIKDILEKQ